MKTITVAQLRQNPAPALAEVARGEEYVVVRYRNEIARLVPPIRARQPVSAVAVSDLFESTPVDADWAETIDQDRDADMGEDPWSSR